MTDQPVCDERSLWRRILGPAAFALALLAAGAVAVVGLKVQAQDLRADDAESRAVELESRVMEQAQAITALSDALAAEQASTVASGEQPVTPPPEAIVAQPEVIVVEGPRGPGPTSEQVRSAVIDYFRANPPQPGRSPTSQEIASAVAGYCASRDGCRGNTGAPGASIKGEDGKPGAQGPGPTAAQIAAEVAAYCATGACTGPAGADGQDGRDGQDGAPAPTPGRILMPWLGTRQQECDLIWTADRLEAVNCEPV